MNMKAEDNFQKSPNGIDSLWVFNTKGDTSNTEKDGLSEPTKRCLYITSVTNKVTSNPDILYGGVEGRALIYGNKYFSTVYQKDGQEGNSDSEKQEGAKSTEKPLVAQESDLLPDSTPDEKAKSLKKPQLESVIEDTAPPDPEESKDAVSEEEEEEKKYQPTRFYDLDDKSIKCRNCGEAGHMARRCPNQLRIDNCKLCGQKPHAEREQCQFVLCYACNKGGHVIGKCDFKKIIRCEKCRMNGHEKEKCLVDQYDHKTAQGAAKCIACYDINPEKEEDISKGENEKNIDDLPTGHEDCDLRLQNDLVKHNIWPVIDKEFDTPSRLEELQKILSGEVKGDIDAAQKEFVSMDDDCTVISTYSLEKLLEDINNKKNISKDGKLEDGEVNVSNDKCEPHLNQFETQNNGVFEKNKSASKYNAFLLFPNCCTNCGQRGHYFETCMKPHHEIFKKYNMKKTNRSRHNNRAYEQRNNPNGGRRSRDDRHNRRDRYGRDRHDRDRHDRDRHDRDRHDRDRHDRDRHDRDRHDRDRHDRDRDQYDRDRHDRYRNDRDHHLQRDRGIHHDRIRNSRDDEISYTRDPKNYPQRDHHRRGRYDDRDKDDSRQGQKQPDISGSWGEAVDPREINFKRTGYPDRQPQRGSNQIDNRAFEMDPEQRRYREDDMKKRDQKEVEKFEEGEILDTESANIKRFAFQHQDQDQSNLRRERESQQNQNHVDRGWPMNSNLFTNDEVEEKPKIQQFIQIDPNSSYFQPQPSQQHFVNQQRQMMNSHTQRVVRDPQIVNPQLQIQMQGRQVQHQMQMYGNHEIIRPDMQYQHLSAQRVPQQIPQQMLNLQTNQDPRMQNNQGYGHPPQSYGRGRFDRGHYQDPK